MLDPDPVHAGKVRDAFVGAVPWRVMRPGTTFVILALLALLVIAAIVFFVQLMSA